MGTQQWPAWQKPWGAAVLGGAGELSSTSCLYSGQVADDQPQGPGHLWRGHTSCSCIQQARVQWGGFPPILWDGHPRWCLGMQRG